MDKNKKSLFKPVVDKDKMNPLFVGICKRDSAESARWMLDDIYCDFIDPDGNFLEQFQTVGFNSRFFELYLYACFNRAQYQIQRPKGGPDFIIGSELGNVAIEATTTNPSSSGILLKYGKPISALNQEEMKNYVSEEMPIRFASALTSKLKMRYWELPQMQNLPFIIAIEAFHDDMALSLSDSSIITYVYGIDQNAKFSRRGALEIESNTRTHHVFSSKKIESGFFSLPQSENVSAILFTNAGTYPKFARMGYQHGIANNKLYIQRKGLAYFQDEDAMDAMFFSYSMDNPPQVETWEEGCTILHNPNCLHPLPEHFLPGVTEVYRTDDGVISYSYGWHPYISHTEIRFLGEYGNEISKILSLKGQRFKIAPITKDQFRSITGIREHTELLDEYGWFSDETFSFLGVIVFDKSDEDWGFVILARDKHFTFRCIESLHSYKTRNEAVDLLRNKIAELLQTPKKIYW